MSGRARSGLAVLGAALALAGPAVAQEAFTFPRVYQWETPQQGWLELTLWETGVPSSDVAYDRFGLTGTRGGLWAQSSATSVTSGWWPTRP